MFGPLSNEPLSASSSWHLLTSLVSLILFGVIVVVLVALRISAESSIAVGRLAYPIMAGGATAVCMFMTRIVICSLSTANWCVSHEVFDS